MLGFDSIVLPSSCCISKLYRCSFHHQRVIGLFDKLCFLVHIFPVIITKLNVPLILMHYKCPINNDSTIILISFFSSFFFSPVHCFSTVILETFKTCVSFPKQHPPKVALVSLKRHRTSLISEEQPLQNSLLVLTRHRYSHFCLQNIMVGR